MRLTVPQFRMYLAELDAIRRDEWRMSLAIATNPHVKERDQKKLWDVVKPVRRGKPLRKLSPKHQKEAEALQRMLDEREGK